MGFYTDEKRKKANLTHRKAFKSKTTYYPKQNYDRNPPFEVNYLNEQ